MKAEKILFIAQEINPYVPESDLTKMGRDLPIYALDQNREIRTFMPKWGNINMRRNQLHEVIRLSGMNIVVDDTDHQLIIWVASIMGTRMQVYFIDNEDFYAKRLAELDKEGHEYSDNIERAAFYARSVLETVKKLRWTPDIIHCQGWISAFIPVYLKTAYADEPCFRDCRVVFSPTANRLTLPTGKEDFANILYYRTADADCVKEFADPITPDDFLKIGIKYADGITFSHPVPSDEVVEYARSINKPVLETTDGQPAGYIDFFDRIWNEHHKENPED